MKLVVKIHQMGDRTVVACCDSSLLGQLIEEKGVQLDLSSEFYKGKEFENVGRVGDILRNADVVNLVGDDAIKLGLSEGVIDPDHIKLVNGVPHAQACILHD